MHKKISFYSMHHSDIIKQYVLEKAEKLDHFFKLESSLIDVEIILEAYGDTYYKVEVIVKSNNYYLVTNCQGSDLYVMIDEAIYKMVSENYSMNKRIVFRSMNHSDIIKQYVLDKSGKLDSFFKREPSPITIEIILEAHIDKYYKVEVIVNSKNYHLVAHSQGPDIFLTIDGAMHIMVREIVHKKEIMGHDITQSRYVS